MLKFSYMLDFSYTLYFEFFLNEFEFQKCKFSVSIRLKILK